MRKIRVLVVDDSTVVRRILTDALAADPLIELAGTASNGRLALAKIPQVNPDVVTLDMEMPELDGLGTLKELRKTWPKLPVIMFSTLTERGAVATLDALSLGANDYVTKPANVGSVTASIQAVRDSLVPKIKAHCPWFEQAPVANSAPVRLPLPASRFPLVASGTRRRTEILVIGTSTGGPNALSEVIPQLPADFPVPVVVVQHMPPIFTTHLARRLNELSPLRVEEARGGESLQPGTVWIAPGDFHLTIAARNGRRELLTNQNPPENSCRPAVDVLFRSAAEVYGSAVQAVVMTGMGCDGQRGGEAVKAAGGTVYAQDEASSVVWGMPGAVVRAGLSDRVLPLNAIAKQLVADLPSRTLARTGV